MKLKRYYIVLYDVTSVDMFMGYTDNEFIIDEIQRSDELNVYIIYEFECYPNELEHELLYNFNVTLDEVDHKLKLYESKDKTTYIVSSNRQLDEIICETDCYETTLIKNVKAFLKLQSSLKKIIKDKEVMRFVDYMFINYLCPNLFKFFGDYELDQLSIDKVKLLAKEGYVGTIKTTWR